MPKEYIEEAGIRTDSLLEYAHHLLLTIDCGEENVLGVIPTSRSSKETSMLRKNTLYVV